MNQIRVFLSILIFSVCCYLIIDLFITGFDGLVLCSSLIGFVITHYLWPTKPNEEEEWYDIFEAVIDFPYRCISIFLRGIGRAAKDSDVDF